MLMKPFVMKECIRRVSGDEMDAEIQALRIRVPRMGRSVMKVCIRCGRQSFIDKELMRLHEEEDWAAITKFLHCGSGESVKSILPRVMKGKSLVTVRTELGRSV